MPTARVTTTKPPPVKVSAPPVRVVTGQRNLAAEQAARDNQVAVQQAIAQEKAKQAADASYRARVEEATATSIRNQTEAIRQADLQAQARIIAPPPSPPQMGDNYEARIRSPDEIPRTAQIRSPDEIARTNAELRDVHAIHVVESKDFIGPQQPSPSGIITPASLYGEPTPKIQVPLRQGVSGFIGGVIPLTAGDTNIIQIRNQDQYETPGLEGFKPQTTKQRAEALDLSEKILSQASSTSIIKTPEVVTYTQIPAEGKPTTETKTYKDPATGLIVTEIITTTPQGGVRKDVSGGEVTQTSTSQTLGKKPVTPDLSNPLASIFSGARETSLNELIGVKNIGAIAVGAEQEEQYATPLAVAFGGLFGSATVLAQDFGGELFDVGRKLSGKAPVQVGQSVSTFGIGGDQIAIEQKPRQGFEKAATIFTEAKERSERLIVADPFYAVGEALVQVPLLVVAPLKAASIALKGIGVASKVVKGAGATVKAVATGEKIIGGGKSKLFSATGKPVTEVKPKTSLAASYPEEYAIGEAKAIQAEDIANFGELTPERQAALQASQRGQFEQGVERLQEGKYAIGETTAEYTQSGISKVQRDLENLRTTRITSEEISPALGAKIKQLEKTGSQADLFPTKQKVSADDILNPKVTGGFESTSINLGTGLGRFEKGGEGLFGDIGKVLPPSPPSGGVKTIGDVIESTAKVQGITKAEARRLLEETGTIPPGISDKAVVKGGTEAGAFTSTEAGLGKGAGSYLGDIGKIDDIGKSEDIFVLGKVSESDIDKFVKQTKMPKEDAEEIFKRAGKTKGGQQLLLENQEEITKQLAQSQKLFELEKARTALKKTSASKAISSIEDQATQRKLSDLIKAEKLKKPSTTADLATQAALKKLIAEEKVKIATKVASKNAEEGIDILRAKPRGLVAEAESVFDQSFRKPGGKLGIGEIAGITTGVGVGVGVGLGFGFGEQNIKTKTTQQIGQNILQPQTEKMFKDPLITIQRQFQEQIQPVITKQTPKLTTRFVQEPSQRITELFIQSPKTSTTTKTGLKTSQKNIFDVIQEKKQTTTTTTTEETGIPPGLGFGFPRGGGGDVVPSGKSTRKFYRVFDIAKTPFGRIEYGLGAQVQSSNPIFELSDVIKKKRGKNLNEEFFSL